MLLFKSEYIFYYYMMIPIKYSVLVIFHYLLISSIFLIFPLKQIIYPLMSSEVFNLYFLSAFILHEYHKNYVLLNTQSKMLILCLFFVYE